MARQASQQVGLRSLLPYLHPYRYQILQGCLLLLLTNALEKSVPYMLHGAVDALAAGQLDQVQFYAAAVAALAMCMAGARIASRIRMFNAGRDIEFDLRNDLLAHLHRLGPTFFAKMPTGETMSRAINDLGQVRAMVGFGALNLVNSAVAYPLALGFMGSMSVELTFVALLPYPLLILTARYVGKRMLTRSQAQQRALGTLASRVQEYLAGIRVVRAFNNTELQHARFEEANMGALKANMDMVFIRGVMWPLLIGLGSLGTLLVLFRGLYMVEEETLTVGELVAFLAYCESLRWPTMGLGYILAIVQRGRAAYGRIREVLDTAPDIEDAPDAGVPGQQGDLVIRNLEYSYGAQPVLSQVSFHAPAQSSLAIVGPTGSGKSTLASLLVRLLPTGSGQVFLDGEDITVLRSRALRKTIGYAQQEPFLFSDTIARNIGYSLDDPYSEKSLERIRAAAREACILNEIEDLPRGFETLVGERGVQLSGGQKQRIALARALLNEPRVLIMDDPLSAVDANTEANILQALERAGEGKTLILITNRVAAARRANRIIVLDDGHVVEQGTHDALLHNAGLYAKLAERQQLEESLSSHD